MASKFSKLPLTKTLAAFGGPVLVGLLIGLGWYTAGAQTPASTPVPSPTPKPKVAFIRFWNMLPDPKNDTLDLYLDTNQLLTRSNASTEGAAYIPVLPNTYTLYAQRSAGTNPTPIKTPAVRMLDGSFFTVLATSQNGQIALEVIDDTIDPKTDNGSVRLVVRQYYPGARAVVTASSAQPITVNYGETSILEHLPTGTLPITIQATLPGKTPKLMNLSANYSAHHHGTLLIIGDLYGRFRPFLTVDGYSDLNLTKVMERWLQTSRQTPVLLPTANTGDDANIAESKPSRKIHGKDKTKAKRKHQPRKTAPGTDNHPNPDGSSRAVAHASA